MHITMEIPLTAAILRAMLSDMEDTAAASECCAGSQCRDAGGLDAAIAKYAEPTMDQRMADAETVYANAPFVEPLTSGIVGQGNPFVAAADYFANLTPTLPSVAADEALLAACQEPSSGLPPVPTPSVTAGTIPGTGGVVGSFPTLPVNLTPGPVSQVTQAPPPPAPPTGVKVDGEGLPWDQRIHASTRTFRQSDNTWKLRKGADPALVETVKAELRTCMAVPAPVAPVVTPPVPQPPVVAALSGSWTPETAHVIGIPVPPAPPADEPRNYSGAQSGGYTPQPPPVPAPPVTIIMEQEAPTTMTPTLDRYPDVPGSVVTLSPAPGAMSFTDFVTWATGKMVAKEISRTQLEEACKSEGISSMPMLQNRPDLIPAIHKFLASICIPASSVGGA